MKSQTIVWKGQELLNVVMEEDTYALEQVNVVKTGYQNIDKRHLTSAVTSVKASDVLVPGMTSIDQALEGRIPELALMMNSGEGIIRITSISSVTPLPVSIPRILSGLMC